MKQKYVYVNFKGSKFNYIYFCGNDDLRVGNIVEAPVNNYKESAIAIVTKIKKLSDSKLPYPKDKILKLEKIVSKKDYEYLFDSIKFLKSKIVKKYLADWKFLGKNSWARFYETSYLAKILYEKDLVVTCSLGYELEEDYFQFGFRMNPKNLRLKIKYLQSILSMLYYKEITEKEFNNLILKLY